MSGSAVVLEIEFWSDLHCPWAYVAARRLRRALQRFPHPTRVFWRYWPLELVDRVGTPRAVIEAERAILSQIEPEAFTLWQRDDYPVTFLPAMALAKAASLQGEQAASEVDLAIREGFFLYQRNVALLHELFEIVSQTSVDLARLENDFWFGHGWRLLWDDWQASQQRRIQGSPHLFLVNGNRDIYNPGIETRQSSHGYPIIVQDDPDFLLNWLHHVWRDVTIRHQEE